MAGISRFKHDWNLNIIKTYIGISPALMDLPFNIF